MPLGIFLPTPDFLDPRSRSLHSQARIIVRQKSGRTSLFLNSIRLAKISVRLTSLVVWLIIALVVAGPVLGFLVPGSPGRPPLGLKTDLTTLGPQFESLLSTGKNLSQTNFVVVPISNNWFFPAKVTLTLGLVAQGSLVYRTPLASADVPAFSSGYLSVPVQLPKALLAQIAGKSLTLGGNLTLGAPSYLLTITVPLTSGGQ